MQYKGMGEDYVSILMGVIEEMFPVNTPQAKEELYYRKIHDEHFKKIVRGTR